MITAARNTKTRRLLGTLVALCFLAQQLVVPLHLALEDHSFARELAPAVSWSIQDSGHHHHAGGHGHSHAVEHDRWSSDVDGERHPPHPADEHSQERPDPAVLTLLAFDPPAPPDGAPVVFELDVPADPVPLYDTRVPQRPPPDTSAAPRAPPAA